MRWSKQSLGVEMIQIDAETVARYDRLGPRYTSYPTVPQWHDSYGQGEVISALKRANLRSGPLSLYIHLPFCKSTCSFCGCNHVADPKQKLTAQFAPLLEKELDLFASNLPKRRDIVQLHLGGGTPTWLTSIQLDTILNVVGEKFNFLVNAEKSIEVHPAVTTISHIEVLAAHGFQRISMGVQDFDPQVQEIIGRIQSVDMTRELIAACRERGFSSVNLDLIYGLPAQTANKFDSTLTHVINLRPERIALYSYAHLPARFSHQSTMPLELLPSSEEKMKIFLLSRRRLLEAGYIDIGMDHFVLPEDDMAKALLTGELHRNFMGYSTKAGSEMIAVGPSAISMLEDSYFQLNPHWASWRRAVEMGELSIVKGINLDEETQKRRDAIMSWMCNRRIDKGEDFPNHWITHLKSETISPLVEEDEHGWHATNLGNLFLRVIAMGFDPSFNGLEEEVKHQYSQTV